MRSMQGVRKNKLVAVGGLFLVLGCAAEMQPRERQEAPPSTLPALVTLTGAHSHIADARCLRITTQAEWAALWLEHLGEASKADDSLYHNKAGLPVVDFERCMVVAIFGGASVNSAGYAAGTVPAGGAGIPSGDGAARLIIKELGYQTLNNGPPGSGGEPPSAGAFFWSADADDGGDRVTPFAFFVVPRTLGPLVLLDRGENKGSQRWQERARFPALPEVPPASDPEPLHGR